MPTPTMTIRLKSPVNGRKQNLSSTTPKPAIMSVAIKMATHGFTPAELIKANPMYPPTIYTAPCARLRIPSMLKRKANPSATRMYIEDKIRTLNMVATTCSMQTFSSEYRLQGRHYSGGPGSSLDGLRQDHRDIQNISLRLRTSGRMIPGRVRIETVYHGI